MKKILLVLILLLNMPRIFAEEGMWIPLLLEHLNISRMQDLGLKLNAEDIYSVNHTSMKDAIVLFGSGCTAEFISPEGLLLTNHHCGLGSIQRLSSLEHDYLTNGFFAASQEDELPVPGLTVTLLIRMEDVTDQVLKHVTGQMSQLQRQQEITKAQETLEKQAVAGTRYEAKVRSFFYGNQYYLFLTRTFKDVRLVAAPPSGIGQFGGDTDNWMWPRHGADFSLFRVYADDKGESMAYNKTNVPYRPLNFFPISLKGYKKGDFTFVFGYPGTTREYLTSYGVELIAGKENPVRTNLRGQKLDILKNAMNSDKRVRIQYTAKAQAIANGWKKMLGETRGISEAGGIAKKRDVERRFQAWADSLANLHGSRDKEDGQYPHLLNEFAKTYQALTPVDLSAYYLTEAGTGIELVKFVGGFRSLVKKSLDKAAKLEETEKEAVKVLSGMKGFYKDYAVSVDRTVAEKMLPAMAQQMEKKYLPGIFRSIGKSCKNDYPAYVAHLFEKTLFTDSAKVGLLLRNYKPSDYKKIDRDPAYQLAVSIYDMYEQQVQPRMTLLNATVDSLQHIYMAGIMKMMDGKTFYPDANSTLRVAFGKVDDYSPRDGVGYRYFSTSQGILEKEDSAVYDYTIDPKLKSMLLAKDFGKYADPDGTLHVTFIASNHTTGGNSGSPVLNGEGQLIGLNYDRNWEGTMSDLIYDPGQCRNIALDIRYFMFLIDRYAGASRLVKEMKLIE